MKRLFDNIVGNDALRQRLGNDILASKLPHAFILEGPKGTGKHTIARTAAAALVCEARDEANAPLPCGKCLACRKVFESNSPDVITVGRGEKATIGIDAIRFIKDDVTVVPNDSDHKVYIIEDADKMTDQAQNGLLLTLEEPPRYVHFFLLCENSGAFLETIRSRAPILRTELLTRGDIDRYISENDRRAAQMKLTDPTGYAELIAASGVGIGRALEYLEPKAFAPAKQNRALVYDIISAILNQKGAREIIPLLSRFSTKRDLLNTQLSLTMDAVRDLILIKKSDEVSLSFFADTDTALELSDKASLAFLYNMSQTLSNTIDEIGRNANVRLSLIKFVLNANIL